MLLLKGISCDHDVTTQHMDCVILLHLFGYLAFFVVSK